MKINDFKLKKNNSKISMITCYDYLSACIVSESNIDGVLVGDSVSMVMYGYPNTTMTTIDMITSHTKAVYKGIKNKFIISDLPFLGYCSSLSNTIKNVKKIIQSGAQAIKIEGGNDHIYKTINFLVNIGIPIMGHIGLTPQSIYKLGGYTIQGTTKEEQNKIIHQAKNLESSGCFSILIECVPESLAKIITKSIKIPTIGIGAGPNTDGQILVWHDLLGIQTKLKPKFLKQYTKIKNIILNSINTYNKEVKENKFPTIEYTYQ
ncbi:3-methyl-2-oxobutanoate hydroxymethyltransferase [Candidatus Legionella polyplacis]|uniref:3-methyl-2-oxobutanoate hydroxymethyltransferase n=1 Tax=Candidatus Legionella polyplacis TaxID=2005262 RepID=UPI000C1F675A|nr:3-methyl-2-oxobutanoate hydroxymethyltransferase [Candidatus Legionella polyplacis]ATW01937.1 3-methyl-2-oxobutanoate hydroxymethyltransferase [Candidatus Legionella polyplacis]